MRESFQVARFEAQPAGESDYLVCGAASTRAARKAAGPEGGPCATLPLVMPTEKGFMQVSLDKSWTDGGMRAGGADHQQTRIAVSVFHAQSLLTHERKIR